jgi:uncharacterized protein involved in type VI secretion and phage assembly
MSAEEDGIEDDDLRLPGWPYEGTVVDTIDPKGVGRVKINVPGVAEPTGWAWPISAGGGAARRGTWSIPPLGATVLVWFVQGSPDRPVYIGGYWGSNVPGAGENGGSGSEAPERVRDIPLAERASVTVVETAAWVILADDRAPVLDESGDPTEPTDGETLVVRHKASGTSIEIDGARRGIQMIADTILLRAEGQVTIDGLVVQIAGRPVRPDAGLI